MRISRHVGQRVVARDREVLRVVHQVVETISPGRS